MNSQYLIGIDEVGRGPVAGPVTVCAFKILEGEYEKLLAENFFDKLRDSKKLSLKKREEWFEKFAELEKQKIIEYSCLSKTASEIDSIGISICIQKLIEENLIAVKADSKDKIFLDGSLNAPAEFINQETIIKGDEKIPVISCASIIAKVLRDRKMTEFDAEFPEYGLDKHKGYGTAKHMEAIKKHGVSKIHRLTYLKNL
jgi:ribonuclease HII